MVKIIKPDSVKKDYESEEFLDDECECDIPSESYYESDSFINSEGFCFEHQKHYSSETISQYHSTPKRPGQQSDDNED
ncbi:hypothetical protein JKP22_01740 [Vibrio vulnificus]|uniref:hypothetical protein n=1 Tax=Vibrio vulnificus TaxID=672 RepID=UPI001CDC6EB4|nr:hypothetical protein [Vibrio vulnificus]MCA4011493.1 hypothetical protein [Vibrio vulnificus]